MYRGHDGPYNNCKRVLYSVGVVLSCIPGMWVCHLMSYTVMAAMFCLAPRRARLASCLRSIGVSGHRENLCAWWAREFVRQTWRQDCVMHLKFGVVLWANISSGVHVSP